ncbi:MAG: DUF3823 domain-containing protein [Bacteroidales bacterium]|nr:DUF3823 domain-containing protein [Bacteroidales bacterium]
MKTNIFHTTLVLLALSLGFTACETDNYDEPEAAITGQVYDHNGLPFQTAVGQGSMSIKIVEKSYSVSDSSVVVIPQYLNMTQEGGFTNTKLFAGTYEVCPWQGAFYEQDGDGDAADVVLLKSGKTTTVNFSVTPYLTLEWVKEPYMDSEGYLNASFKFYRNQKEGYDMPTLNDCSLYISHTQYCGTEADSNYTPNPTKLTADMEGQEISMKSKIPIRYAMHYWVRFGARCSDTYQKYNFTTIEEIEVTSAQLAQ